MKNRREMKFSVVILNIVCAFCWILCSIIDFVKGNLEWMLALHLFCAVVWTYIAIRRYIEYQQQQSELEYYDDLDE